MFFTGATVPGGASENEDWLAATPDLIVVLDGATVRTETGCHHGPAWYTRKLGAAIIAAAADRQLPLAKVLAAAISEVTTLHPECDLERPGAPSAGAGIVRRDGDVLRYLVLGDISIAADTTTGVTVISDERVSATAPAERAEADRYLIGDPDKAAALVKMKEAELAAQNRDGGYWIAAANPAAVEHALAGEFDLAEVRQFGMFSDGAARLVKDFGLTTWAEVIELMAASGPVELINRVRKVEEGDPLGEKYRRNKKSDDATAVYVRV
ncbi:hypothetical protein L3Q67_45150 (plasmid) [Saccharothrix sp. AJ9571]|nr:hypothetical protein L3Q67_45150 [Saccharothrix sp. AJ9571]